MGGEDTEGADPGDLSLVRRSGLAHAGPAGPRHDLHGTVAVLVGAGVGRRPGGSEVPVVGVQLGVLVGSEGQPR